MFEISFFLKIIFLSIYWNHKFHFPKILPHPSTLSSKSILVNFKGISVFYPLLKTKIKMISVNMKNGNMNVVCVAISINYSKV